MGSIVQKLQHCSCIYLFCSSKSIEYFYLPLFFYLLHQQIYQFAIKYLTRVLNAVFTLNLEFRIFFFSEKYFSIFFRNFFYLILSIFLLLPQKENYIDPFVYKTQILKKIIFHKTEMKPNRPGSAKSTHTRVTVDSDFSSNALNASKFSQTYSNGVNANNEKKKDFHQYVKEKNKDPRFKKFVQQKLPQIPEKMDASLQLSKLTSKPFQKKNSKIEKSKPQKKIQEPPPQKKTVNGFMKNSQSNNTNPKTFMDKSKQKLKITAKKQPQALQQTKKYNSINVAPQATVSNGNDRINFTGFTIKVPGKPVQKIQQIKKESPKKKKSPEEQEQERKKQERSKLFTQLSEFVQEVESRNLDYFPGRYDAFVENNLSRVRGDMEFDIQKINIQDFMEEPNERDYEKLMRKINDCDKKLQGDANGYRKKITTQSSINLEQMLDGTGKDEQEENSSSVNDISVMMTSMSASDVRDRNMFLTEILKGKRLTQEQLESIQQNDESRVKMMKLEDEKIPKEEQQEQEQNYEGGYLTQLNNLSTVSSKSINMTKRKNNRFLERNKIEAAGQLYRECDYLSPEEQKRIEDLIGGVQIESPFIFSEMETFKNRRIDEGIKIHRELHKQIDGQNTENDADVINEAALPKDPLLKKEAQLKILKQKINSVNSRLKSVEQVVVNKNKIKALADKFKEITKISKMGESLIQEKQKQLEEQSRKLKEAEEMIIRAEGQREEIIAILKQMEDRYKQMQREVDKIREMDEKQLRKMYEDELKQKRRKVEEVEKQAKCFDEEIEQFCKIGEELKKHLEALDEIMNIEGEQIKCENYHEDETIEDLDELITKKWQAAEQAVRNLQQYS